MKGSNIAVHFFICNPLITQNMRKNFHSESLYWVVKNVLPSNLLMNVRAVDGALHAILLFPFFHYQILYVAFIPPGLLQGP